MPQTIKKNENIKERIYINTLSCGTKCYIIPKKGYSKMQAAICVKYGSNDTEFISEGKKIIVPSGTAHFIEHKLFEEEYGDVFAEFSKNGADANAFTDFVKTVYYFSCTKDFEENFKRLLSFVQSPYFNEKSVENEKGIISSEIKMYDDNSDWQVFFGALQGIYEDHKVKENIAGTIESIKKIDAEILQKTYENFYSPENMFIVCVGDFNCEEVFNIAENTMKSKNYTLANVVKSKDIEGINEKYVENILDISKTIFNIAFKHKISRGNKNPKKIYGFKILFDIICGEGSNLYDKLYKNNIIEEELAYEFLTGDDFAVSIISGKCDEPKIVVQFFKEEIERLKKEGFSITDFERIHKKHIGRFIRGFNSIDAICMSQIDLGYKGTDILEAYDNINEINSEYINKLLKDEIDLNCMVLSVIKGKK